MRYLTYWILVTATAPVFYAQTAATSYNITTFAGSGTTGFSGDGSAGTSAELANPCGLAVTGSGTLFITDQLNQRVRQVSSGTINTVAGSGTAGYTGDGKAATAAELSSPCGIALDSSGNVYVSDTVNNVVRKFTVSGTISTVAGSQGLGAGYTGDGGAANGAQLFSPGGLAVDSSGNLYIADTYNHAVRKVTSSGTISTIAGAGVQGYSGDGGPATSAALNYPADVAVDTAGDVFIADSENQAIRKVTPDGTISTVAGTGIEGFSGDLGNALQAELNFPSAVAVDSNGDIYISDRFNSRIRKVFPNGTITTIAGDGLFKYSGDGGPATSASLSFPMGLAVDSAGNVYVADAQNDVVRILAPVASSAEPPVVTSVSSVFGGSTSAAPGSWIEINGSNLAATTRTWSEADFNGANAPTSLAGTTVTIGGQRAVIDYVSGGQINAVVPESVGSGQQTVTVSTVEGFSAPFSIVIDQAQEALLAPPSFDLGGKQYVDAVLSGGAGYALPAGAISGLTSRPAHTGETISLYGIGFGTVSPNVAYGQVAGEDNTLTGSLQVFIGGVPAAISYDGLEPGTVGLYQFNVVVPSGVSGSAVPLTYTFNGVAGHQTLYTAVD